MNLIRNQSGYARCSGKGSRRVFDECLCVQFNNVSPALDQYRVWSLSNNLLESRLGFLSLWVITLTPYILWATCLKSRKQQIHRRYDYITVTFHVTH